MHPYPFRFRLIAVPLRYFFKIFYTRLAWTYDWVAAAVSFGRWNDWVFSVIPYLKGPRILELGYGPGHLLVKLHQTGYGVVGLDASLQMSRIARKRLIRNKHSGIVVNGYAQFAPFQQSSFEQIIATFPSDYILCSNTLSEIWRLLVPQGELIVVPFAWVSNLKLYERAATCLSRLTGFPSNWDSIYCGPLRQQGFEVHVETLTKPSSMVTVILA